jgi:Flp pilus assembly protein TadD
LIFTSKAPMDRRDGRTDAGQSSKDVAAAHYQAGLRHQQAGRFLDAQLCCKQALEADPNHLDSLHLMGLLALQARQFDHAIEWIARANEQDPNTDYLYSVGVALEQQGLHAEAFRAFDRAVQIKRDDVEIWLSHGKALENLGRPAEALSSYRQVLRLDPRHAEAELNMAMLQLLTGDFEQGWPSREARRRTAIWAAAYPKFTQPMWQGCESVEGKTILVYEDEGYGDAIQFARYVPLLAARGARVILVVGDALVPLLSQLSGVSQCLPKSATALPAFDMHCPACSLPLAFGTRLDTIPLLPSYLAAPSERARAWEQALLTDLGPRDRLRVGLAWSGRPTHLNDHRRSIPLHAFSPLLGANAMFISLQKDVRPDDKAQLAKGRLIDVAEHLVNFAETAALMSCLDLVITVDTSVAHLAGALGRPTWLLLPFTPDWRWLLERDDSPWYPSLRLFRQSEARDWAEVLDSVQRALAARITAS